MMTKRIGIIDMGSNSARFVVYEVYGSGAYQPIFEMKQGVKLAHYMTDDLTITNEGIHRATACIQLFRQVGETYQVGQWTAVATAAVRQAANQLDVLQAIEQETNLPLRVLSGHEEGYYGYLGVINSLQISDAVLFDIGGASSELMYVRDRQCVDVRSLPFGALNLTKQLEKLPEDEQSDFISERMADALATIPWLNEAKNLPLVGMGGTMRALAKYHLTPRRDTRYRLHGYTFPTTFAADAMVKLQAMSLADRRKIKGISRGRAEVLFAGVGIIASIADAFGSTMLVVSRNGVREGLFHAHHAAHSSQPVVDSVRQHSLLNFQKLFGVNETVSESTTAIGAYLFDHWQPLHQLSPADRETLLTLCQIESAGSAINTERWMTHSGYLATHARLYGFSDTELADITDVLRGQFDPRLRKLSVLLRLAKRLALQFGGQMERFIVRSDAKTCYVVSDREEDLRMTVEDELLADFQKAFGRPLKYVSM